MEKKTKKKLALVSFGSFVQICAVTSFDDIVILWPIVPRIYFFLIQFTILKVLCLVCRRSTDAFLELYETKTERKKKHKNAETSNEQNVIRLLNAHGTMAKVCPKVAWTFVNDDHTHKLPVNYGELKVVTSFTMDTVIWSIGAE